MRGYSQADMAEKLGISEPYYSMIENGHRQKALSLPMAVKLSEELNISMRDIIRMEVESRQN